MKFSKRQHLVLNLINAMSELSEAEQLVEDVGGVQSRLAMAEKYTEYERFREKAEKEFNDIELLEETIAHGASFFKYLKGL